VREVYNPVKAAMLPSSVGMLFENRLLPKSLPEFKREERGGQKNGQEDKMISETEDQKKKGDFTSIGGSPDCPALRGCCLTASWS